MRAILSNWRKEGRLATAALSFAAGVVATCALLWSAQPNQASRSDIAGEVSHLSLKVQQLEKKQASAGLVLNQHRNSICYIYGVYSVGRGATRTRTSFSGTGFVVANGVIATNRHVAEPWWDDAAAQAGSKQGEQVSIERMLAFFPGTSSPVALRDVNASTQADVAVARFIPAESGTMPAPIPLATTAATPGDSVVVIGYPLGLMGMLAKSPRETSRRLMNTPDDIQVARELAQLSLIRPSATSGYVGDVLEDILVYDAPTARGGSGAPVFNSNGEVIAVTSAYLRGFSGGTLGISVNALRPLLEQK